MVLKGFHELVIRARKFPPGSHPVFANESSSGCHPIFSNPFSKGKTAWSFGGLRMAMMG
jgi:hypothetical protein